MDWQKVTFSELVDALKTVSWSAPRPLSEFFRAFGMICAVIYLECVTKSNSLADLSAMQERRVVYKVA